MEIDIPNNMQVTFALPINDYELMQSSGMLAIAGEKDPSFQTVDYTSLIDEMEKAGKLTPEVMQTFANQVVVACYSGTGVFLANVLASYGAKLESSDMHSRMYNTANSIMRQMALQVIEARGEDSNNYDLNLYTPFPHL